VVTRVSADQNSRNLGSIINFVDVVFIAEDLVVVFNSSSSLARERTVDFVRERSDGVDGSSVNSMSMVGVRVI